MIVGKDRPSRGSSTQLIVCGPPGCSIATGAARSTGARARDDGCAQRLNVTGEFNHPPLNQCFSGAGLEFSRSFNWPIMTPIIEFTTRPPVTASNSSFCNSLFEAL